MKEVMPSLSFEINGKVESSRKKLSKEKSSLNGYLPHPPPPEDSESTSMKNLFRTWVTDEYEKLLETFKKFDTKKNFTISVGDLKNTIRKLFFQLDDKYFDEILSQVIKKPDGTIYYHNFLKQFCNMDRPKSTDLTELKSRGATSPSVSPSPSSIEEKSTVGEIKLLLSEKFCKNVFAVLKALRFYDYNRNGRINKINFRKVLEEFGFKLTNRQFERFWQTENSNRSCIMDYKHFLQKLVTSGNISNSSSGDIDNLPSPQDFWDPKTGIVIQPSSSWPPFQKVFQLSTSDEQQILRRLELQMRDIIHRHHYKIRKAFETADPKLQGFVQIEILKKILETYMNPMSDEVFAHLMQCLGLQPTGLIAWQVFLNKFRCTSEYGNDKQVEFMDIPKEIVPLKNSECYVDVNTVLLHLRQKFIHQYGSIEEAFRKLDHHGRGWLTRTDIEIEVKKLYYHQNEIEYHEVFVKLDPDHRNKITLPKFMEVLETEGTEFLAAEPAPPPQDPVKPRSVSWEKVELVLRENIVIKSEELKNQIILASTKDKGLLCSKRLKCILDTVVFPIEEQHFQSLLSRYSTPRKDGLIDCQQFFEKLVGSQNLFIVPNSVPENCCKQQKSAPEKRSIQPKSAPVNCSIQPISAPVNCSIQPISAPEKQCMQSKSIPKIGIRPQSMPENSSLPLDLPCLCKCPIESLQKTMVDSCPMQKIEPQNFSMQQAKKDVSSRESHPSSFLVTAEKFPYVLAEKSQKSTQNITKNYLTYRKAGKDILNLELLQNLLKMLDICISGTEMNKLWKRCDPEEKGYAFYEDFLTGCGLEEVYKRNNEVGSMSYILMWKVAGEIGPGFLGNTVTSSVPRLRSKNPNEKKFDGPSPEFRIREFIIKSPHNIWKSIANLDMEKTSLLLASEIRNVLVGYGLRMTDAEWNFILDAVGTEGKDILHLKKFIAYIMKGLDSPYLSNGPKKCETLEEVEIMMQPIISDRKSDMLRAFREFDTLNEYTIGKQDFEDTLQKFRICMDIETFEKFWSSLILTKDNKLMYNYFLDLYSNPHRISTAVQTIEPAVKINVVQPLPERPMTAPVLPTRKAQNPSMSDHYFIGQTMVYPECKIHPSPDEQNFTDTSGKALEEILSKRLGEVLTHLSQASAEEDPYINPEDLKSILESVSYPIDEDLFNSMLSQFVTVRHDGRVNYQEFLMHLIPWRSNSGRALGGELRRVIPSISHETNQPYHSVTASQLPSLLSKLTQNQYHNVTKGYLTFAKAGKDIITMITLKNFLKAFNIFMNDNELKKLWQQVDPEDKQYITYEEFLERCCLEEVYKGSMENGASKYVIIWKLIEKSPCANMNQESFQGPGMMSGENLNNLTTENYLRESLMNMNHDIWKAILDLDVQKTDLVPSSILQNLLVTHGIKMTDNEWKQVLQPYTKNGFVNIKSFISHLLYGTLHPNAGEGQLTSKFLKDIQKVISTNSNDFLAAFKEADYADLKTVSQESFQNILTKFGITIDQATFLQLWSLLPVNGNNNLQYKDFLNWVNSQTTKPYTFKRPSTTNIRSYEPWKPSGPHLPSTGRTTGRTSKEILPLEIHEMRRRKRAVTADAARKRERHCYLGRLVNAEEAEFQFRDVILGNWKLIQKRCRTEDPDCTGYVDPQIFKGILHHYIKQMDEDKFERLSEKFDIKGDGTLAYKDLIRYFVFNLKPSKLIPGQHRLLRKPEKDEYDTVPTEGLLGEALRRLRQCVTKNWRIMRHSFQIADPNKSDTVDILTFRQILKVHNVNLTEEEFFQIMSFYDKDFSASINYNSFLRAFLGNR